MEYVTYRQPKQKPFSPAIQLLKTKLRSCKTGYKHLEMPETYFINDAYPATLVTNHDIEWSDE
jgi:hypothetical protein